MPGSISRRTMLGVGAAVALAGCGKQSPATVGSRPGGYAAGTEITSTGWRLPSVELTDTTGATAPMNTHHGSAATLVFFGYTNCPDVCPGIMADLASALQRVDAAVRDQVRVVIVTTDPARDTPQVLKEYLARIDPAFVGLTGKLDVIVKAAETIGLSIDDAKKLPSGGYEVTHSTQVLGFGKDESAAVLWSSGTSVADYITDITLLVDKQK
ncbi:SCO family protein [Aestuariimicrobium soli]|uniref:SCO family protein n=1 Tax=Aestuariimicrobium soli TaxID=2035834 RepID=UPI003EBEE3D5